MLIALIWLHAMIWSYSQAFLRETVGAGLQPVIMFFFMISSVIGGWNTDTSDIGYQVSLFLTLIIESID